MLSKRYTLPTNLLPELANHFSELKKLALNSDDIFLFWKIILDPFLNFLSSFLSATPCLHM